MNIAVVEAVVEHNQTIIEHVMQASSSSLYCDLCGNVLKMAMMNNVHLSVFVLQFTLWILESKHRRKSSFKQHRAHLSSWLLRSSFVRGNKLLVITVHK